MNSQNRIHSQDQNEQRLESVGPEQLRQIDGGHAYKTPVFGGTNLAGGRASVVAPTIFGQSNGRG